jgi:hypothetical protein
MLKGVKESVIFKKIIELGYNIYPIPEGLNDFILKI